MIKMHEHKECVIQAKRGFKPKGPTSTSNSTSKSQIQRFKPKREEEEM